MLRLSLVTDCEGGGPEGGAGGQAPLSGVGSAWLAEPDGFSDMVETGLLGAVVVAVLPNVVDFREPRGEWGGVPTEELETGEMGLTQKIFLGNFAIVRTIRGTICINKT